MAEVYGEAQAMSLADPDWIRDAAAKGWAIFSKDKKLRKGQNRSTIEQSAAKAFILSKGSLSGKDQLLWFLRQIHRISLRAKKPGPMIHMVSEKNLSRNVLSPKTRKRNPH
jgi:hypothetical protein